MPGRVLLPRLRHLSYLVTRDGGNGDGAISRPNKRNAFGAPALPEVIERFPSELSRAGSDALADPVAQAAITTSW
jgi:hypothetical protein